MALGIKTAVVECTGRADIPSGFRATSVLSSTLLSQILFGVCFCVWGLGAKPSRAWGAIAGPITPGDAQGNIRGPGSGPRESHAKQDLSPVSATRLFEKLDPGRGWLRDSLSTTHDRNDRATGGETRSRGVSWVGLRGSEGTPATSLRAVIPGMDWQLPSARKIPSAVEATRSPGSSAEWDQLG